MSLRLVLPRKTFRPGERIRGRIELTWKGSDTLRRITVSLIGQETTRVVELIDGHNARRERREYRGRRRFLKVDEDLANTPASLERGSYEFPLNLLIPEDAVASYSGTQAKVKYTVEVVVQGTRKTLATARKVVHLNPPSNLKSAPVHQRRTIRSVGVLKPFGAPVEMELDLSSCRFRRNEPLKGRLRVVNPTARKIRWVRITLRKIETARALGFSNREEGVVERGYLRVPRPTAPQQTISFRVKLRNGPYPFRGRTCRLDYVLILRLEIPWATDPLLRVPVAPRGNRRPRRRRLRARRRRRT